MVPAGISVRRFLPMMKLFAGFPTPERITASAPVTFIGQIKRTSTASLEIGDTCRIDNSTSKRSCGMAANFGDVKDSVEIGKRGCFLVLPGEIFSHSAWCKNHKFECIGQWRSAWCTKAELSGGAAPGGLRQLMEVLFEITGTVAERPTHAAKNQKEFVHALLRSASGEFLFS